MNFYGVMSIILTIAALFAYLNYRYIKLPTTIAIMSASLLTSLLLILIGKLGFTHLDKDIANILSQLDFRALLMNGMLSFLLFAGALTVDVSALKNYKWEIGILATVSTIASTVLVGYASYYLLAFLGIHMPMIYCFLFGALISPTDPIAVLAMLKEIKAPKSLEVKIAGESLFNDGVGIVIFLTLYQLAFSHQAITVSNVTLLFMKEAVGGILYGLALGITGYKLIKSVNDGKVQILITLAMATGGYVFANFLDISGPLAMVVAGIFIGNRGRDFFMEKSTRDNLFDFWELLDEILNAILFLLIGFELLLIQLGGWDILATLLTIPMVLMIRFITVATPMSLFKLRRDYSPHTINILTWGGLRGGLAVALALSLPASKWRDIILSMTYAVVVFAIVFQGSTVKPLLKMSQP